MKIEEMYDIIKDGSVVPSDFEMPWTESNINEPQVLDCNNTNALMCFSNENNLDVLENSAFDETRWVTAEVAAKHGLKPDMDPLTLKAEVNGNVVAQDFYNIEQLSSHSYSSVNKAQPTWQPNVEIESLASAMGVKVFNNAINGAYYLHETDHIHLPHQSQFATPEKYYQTFLHELIHSTGHEKRLDRNSWLKGCNERTIYAQEEVTAEFSSHILCKKFGIEPDSRRTSSYTKDWSKVIANDIALDIEGVKNIRYVALENVDKACDYVMDINKDLKLQTIKEAYDKAKQTKGKSTDLGANDVKQRLNPLSGSDKTKATKDAGLKSSLGETKVGESSVLSAYEKAKNKALSKVTKGINPKGKGFDR